VSRDSLLLVTTSYPQAGDGSEAAGAFVADLAAELATRLPVRVVAPGTTAGAEDEHDGVRVRRFASPGRPMSLLSPANPLHWPAILSTLSSLRRETLAIAADGRVAHTLALWVLPSGWAAAALQRQSGVPYSVWALGSDIWSLGRVPGVRQVLGNIAGGASHRYADGFELAAAAQSRTGRGFEFLPSTRRLPGLPPRRFAMAPPYRLLFLGRWHPNKGVDLLLEALAQLGDAGWARVAQVRVAGGGPLDGVVRAAVARLQASGRPVRLDGFLDRDAATAALAEADFLLLPSRVESIPVVFSDAIKAGLPVVSTPVGDLPGLVAGDTPCGVLAQAATAPAIAAAITQALAHPPSIFADGLAAMCERFDLGRIADRIAATVKND
jgi:glycosyltransferase involved in cell wall biosynthesis